jgi:hypothetical protein
VHQEGEVGRQAQKERPALPGGALTRAAAAIAIPAALLALAIAAIAPSRATALIAQPAVLDGPSSQVLELGGAATAADGTGGVVYLKLVDGIAHVFASRFDGTRWGPPIRVDWDQPYAASEPRIAAGNGGRLLVVWVTGVATVKGQVRYGLFSARLGPGADGFGPSLLVDPEVGEGGVDPAVSGVAPGTATVAYRAITYNFSGNSFSTAVQLRPGDVMADIRLARLNGDRWSRLGAVNRNPEASMRPPSPTNGPQVGAGSDGEAVVAWQEPDQTGTARIWVRRVFGNSLGPPLEASPASWEGAAVTADADAFALAATPRNEARVAFRLGGSKGHSARIFLNSLPADYAVPAGELRGAVQVAEGPQGQIGAPAVAAAEAGGGAEGLLSLAFTSGSGVQEFRGKGKPVPSPQALGPAPATASEPVLALDPGGGEMLAYPATDPQGRPAVAVRQELSSAAAQTGLLSSAVGGPVSQLSAGAAAEGDALLAFRQGEPGAYAIVAAGVSAPPSAFKASGPKGWVRPRRARLRWQTPRSGAGGFTYSVLLGGQVVKQGLLRHVYLPPRRVLPSGRLEAQVMATDALGQQVLTPPVRLRVDAAPPRASVRVDKRREVTVRVGDRGAGLAAGSTRVTFGDGTGDRGGSKFRHAYSQPGRFTVAVAARDKLGNRLFRRYRVTVR